MYNTFECHFKPNQKSQSDMTDPVLVQRIETHTKMMTTYVQSY